MATEFRESGISLLGRVPWGTHFCHFYETKEDLLDILVPYFKAGLESNEFCMWIISEPLSQEEARNALGQAVPDLDQYLAAGTIEIIPHNEWYLKGGFFDLGRVVNSWNEKRDQALAKGYAGVRVSGNTSWLQEKDWRDFREYEKEISVAVDNQLMIVLCTYPLATSGAAEILDVAQIHQFAVARRRGSWEIIETPKLKEAKEEIRRLNEELERLVAERTRELEAANEELRKEITERKQVDEQLRRQKEILQKIVDNIPVMIRFYGEDGRVKLVNREYERTLGWSWEELQEQNLDIYAEGYPDPHDREQVLNFIAAATGTWADFKTRVRDGRVIDTSWANIRLSDGTTMGIGQDITERKRSEEQLRFQAQLIEQIQAAIITVGLQGVVTHWNRYAEKLYGWSREETIGRSVQELAIEQPDRELAQHIRDCVWAEGYWEGQFTVRRKDGSLFPAYSINTLIRDTDGQTIGMMGVSFDITERKRIEDDLRRQKEILQTIFDRIPVMINLLNEDGQITLVNREWERVLGWSLEEVVVEHDSILFETFPDLQQRQKALNFVSTSHGEWADFKTRVRDGRVIDTSWAVVHLSDGSAIVFGIDITERKQIERAEREQRALAEALRDTAAALSSTLDFEEVLQRVLENVGRILPHETSVISLLEGDYWRVAGHKGFAERGLEEWIEGLLEPIDERPLYRHIVQTGQPMVVPDTQANPEWVWVPQLAWVRSRISAPIRTRGKVIGLINLHSSVPNFFSDSDGARLQAFADQAAIALENALLLQEVHAGRERLQALSEQLLVAQEAERRAIARELHDEIGQVLTAVGTNLQAIVPMADPATLSKRIGESLDLIDDALRQIRDLSLDLRPSLLDDFGIVPALKWYIDRQAQRSGLDAEFISEPPEIRLPLGLETTCFRVVQISLTNVARHAGAKHVSVELRRVTGDTPSGEVELVIRDDGVGFDVHAALERASHGATLGLLSLQERVRLARGMLDIKSAPGHGTEIRARFPLG